jgi:multiple antibiotic resistance protein
VDTLLSAFITLLLVMDPLGNVPIFLAVLKDVEGRRRYWVIFRELLIALGVLLLFLYGGSTVLEAMGLRQESISIAIASDEGPATAGIARGTIKGSPSGVSPSRP